MRILYFTRDYTTHDRRFLSALARTDHQVFYLRLERGPRQLEDRPLPPEIELVPWEGGQGLIGVKDAPRLLAGFRRVLRQVKPDLVHAGPIQTSALLAALSGFRPLVSMSWGSDLLVDADQDPWMRWATRYALGHSDALVGDCEPVRQKAIQFGMPAERIVTFPWGVDLTHFHPAADERAERNVFTLLSTRGWEPIYGVELIARAFVQACRQLAGRDPANPDAGRAPSRPIPELRLIMLGGGSQAGLLRQIFNQGEVQDQVFFPGQIPQAELPRLYRSADLYLSASRSDGTSISLLEAMACGRPVLVSDIPGNLQWVTPGEQGWLFPDGDANALAQGILQAVDLFSNDPAGLAEMGRSARRLAEQRADWEKNFPQLLDAYTLAARPAHAG